MGDKKEFWLFKKMDPEHQKVLGYEFVSNFPSSKLGTPNKN